MTFPITDQRQPRIRTPDPWSAIAEAQDHLLATIDALISCSPDQRRVLLDELEQDLCAHTAAEEDELYRALLSIPDARDETRRSMVEHRDLEAAVQELRELGFASNRWRDKLTVLQMRLRRHYERELRELLPIAKRFLDSDVLRQIETRLEGAFDRAPASAAA
jgi:hypothetical protein